MELSNTLDSGFLEAVYQEALEIEFKNKQIPYEVQKKLLKALNKITSIEESQVLTYLKVTDLQLGLII